MCLPTESNNWSNRRESPSQNAATNFWCLGSLGPEAVECWTEPHLRPTFRGDETLHWWCYHWVGTRSECFGWPELTAWSCLLLCVFVTRTVDVVLSKQLRVIECMSLLFLVLMIFCYIIAFPYLVDFFGYLTIELTTHFLSSSPPPGTRHSMFTLLSHTLT